MMTDNSERSHPREVDSHGNCSKCGGTHYGSYMCPISQSPQGEGPTPDSGPHVGNTSKPVAIEPQGSVGESPDLSFHISNCDCSYCKTERQRIRDAICANLRPCGHLRLFQFTAGGQYADTDVCQCCEIERLTREAAVRDGELTLALEQYREANEERKELRLIAEAASRASLACECEDDDVAEQCESLDALVEVLRPWRARRCGENS